MAHSHRNQYHNCHTRVWIFGVSIRQCPQIGRNKAAILLNNVH